MGKRVNKTYRAAVTVNLTDAGLGSGEVTLNLKIKASKDPKAVYGSYAKNITIDLTKVNNEPVSS